MAFAAFHFASVSALLFVLSRPPLKLFQAKQVEVMQILPLSLGMIFQVVLTNTSLAYSSIQFYQIMRVFVTPCVAILNYMLLRATIPMVAALTLVPVCLGVGVVSYFETAATGASNARGTSPIGVAFAFAGVFATSLYTVWVKTYHSMLDCTSMQLLLNQAPVSVLLMLYIIPFSDDVTAWKATTMPIWILILLVSIINRPSSGCD